MSNNCLISYSGEWVAAIRNVCDKDIKNDNNNRCSEIHLFHLPSLNDPYNISKPTTANVDLSGAQSLWSSAKELDKIEEKIVTVECIDLQRRKDEIDSNNEDDKGSKTFKSTPTLVIGTVSGSVYQLDFSILNGSLTLERKKTITKIDSDAAVVQSGGSKLDYSSCWKAIKGVPVSRIRRINASVMITNEMLDKGIQIMAAVIILWQNGMMLRTCIDYPSSKQAMMSAKSKQMQSSVSELDSLETIATKDDTLLSLSNTSISEDWFELSERTRAGYVANDFITFQQHSANLRDDVFVDDYALKCFQGNYMFGQSQYLSHDDVLMPLIVFGCNPAISIYNIPSPEVVKKSILSAQKSAAVSKVGVVSSLAGMAVSSLTSRLFSSVAPSVAGYIASKTQTDTTNSENQKIIVKPFGVNAENSFFDDKGRVISSASVYPLTCDYIACVDSIGRVLLLQLSTLIVMRIWKGYRNAQTLWIQGSDGSYFLGILSTNRSRCEIWSCPFGERIKVMKVPNTISTIQSKTASANSTPMHQQLSWMMLSSANQHQSYLSYLNEETASIKLITVPIPTPVVVDKSLEEYKGKQESQVGATIEKEGNPSSKKDFDEKNIPLMIDEFERELSASSFGLSGSSSMQKEKNQIELISLFFKPLSDSSYDTPNKISNCIILMLNFLYKMELLERVNNERSSQGIRIPASVHLHATKLSISIVQEILSTKKNKGSDAKSSMTDTLANDFLRLLRRRKEALDIYLPFENAYEATLKANKLRNQGKLSQVEVGSFALETSEGKEMIQWIEGIDNNTLSQMGGRKGMSNCLSCSEWLEYFGGSTYNQQLHDADQSLSSSIAAAASSSRSSSPSSVISNNAGPTTTNLNGLWGTSIINLLERKTQYDEVLNIDSEAGLLFFDNIDIFLVKHIDMSQTKLVESEQLEQLGNEVKEEHNNYASIVLIRWFIAWWFEYCDIRRFIQQSPALNNPILVWLSTMIEKGFKMGKTNPLSFIVSKCIDSQCIFHSLLLLLIIRRILSSLPEETQRSANLETASNTSYLTQIDELIEKLRILSRFLKFSFSTQNVDVKVPLYSIREQEKRNSIFEYFAKVREKQGQIDDLLKAQGSFLIHHTELGKNGIEYIEHCLPGAFLHHPGRSLIISHVALLLARGLKPAWDLGEKDVDIVATEANAKRVVRLLAKCQLPSLQRETALKIWNNGIAEALSNIIKLFKSEPEKCVSRVSTIETLLNLARYILQFMSESPPSFSEEKSNASQLSNLATASVSSSSSSNASASQNQTTGISSFEKSEVWPPLMSDSLFSEALRFDSRLLSNQKNHDRFFNLVSSNSIAIDCFIMIIRSRLFDLMELLHTLFNDEIQPFLFSQIHEESWKVDDENMRDKIMQINSDIVEKRKAFVFKIVHHNPQNVEDSLYTLSNKLSLDADDVRRERVVSLYEMGVDIVADDLLSRVSKPELIGDRLIVIVKSRLKQIFSSVKSSKTDSYLISIVSPDILSWVQGQQNQPKSGTEANRTSSKKPNPNSTLALLNKLSQNPTIIPESHPQKQTIALARTALTSIIQRMRQDKDDSSSSVTASTA